MGIPLNSNFDVTAALPLDARTVVADLTARDALASGVRFEGMEVYVEAEEKFYSLVGGITNGDWVERTGGGASAGFIASIAKPDNSDSPVTIPDTDNGKLFAADATAGDVELTLPSIAAVTAPFFVAVKKTDVSVNVVTVEPDGSDTIDGGALSTFSIPESGAFFIADTIANNWVSLAFGPTPEDETAGFISGVEEVDESGGAIVIADADAGTLFSAEAVSGQLDFTLPALGDVTEPFFVALQRANGGTEAMVVTPDGAETIAGLATLALTREGEGVFLIADVANNDWKALKFGPSPGRDVDEFTNASDAGLSEAFEQTRVWEGTLATMGVGALGVPVTVPNGARVTLVGSDDDNPLTVQENDASEGIIMQGEAILTRGRALTLEWNLGMSRWFEIGRNF